MTNLGSFAKKTLLMAALLAVPPLFAQEVQEGAGEDATEEVSGNTKKEKGYLNLSVGVYHDERLSDNMPANPSLAGTFRQFTRVEWNPDSKTMRFYPKASGIGTLTIKHPTTGAILAEYTVDIRKTDLQKVAREMQALLQGIEGTRGFPNLRTTPRELVE